MPNSTQTINSKSAIEIQNLSLLKELITTQNHFLIKQFLSELYFGYKQSNFSPVSPVIRSYISNSETIRWHIANWLVAISDTEANCTRDLRPAQKIVIDHVKSHKDKQHPFWLFYEATAKEFVIRQRHESSEEESRTWLLEEMVKQAFMVIVGDLADLILRNQCANTEKEFKIYNAAASF